MIKDTTFGIKEFDTGLVAPSHWGLVARCTKIINPNFEDVKYVINYLIFGEAIKKYYTDISSTLFKSYTNTPIREMDVMVKKQEVSVFVII
ncbi:hypothetical protein JHK82_024864 [Glycine max]|uniref:Uncharacterized protein n=2 Tax=Glycine subgen. Soja TaxID=1462606 RepID=A0A0R0I7F6_SOYBN|nr:hypothetical protein JHK87_024805 [Glycine soja]KAG5006931.1 hypothetical protein JHK85_025473 [Glycine max]KAG5012719.1 hypothetical protein JHK86_024980 [Glycine max]KAG5133676.1 hypothetical protein JHK82_024864 [Glycine max]RZB91749.1 hypothetical protein D0Y65_023939 [Glycine soja]